MVLLRHLGWILNIAHFSTSHKGGGGIAARGLHAALNQQNRIDSKFFAINQSGYTMDDDEFAIERNIRERIISKISSKLNLKLSSTSYFSTFSGLTLEETTRAIRLQVERGAVIHIHNSYNLISFKNILNLAQSGARIVLTLHDQRFFTGACHYALSCNGFKMNCNTCPKVHALIKKKVGANLSNLQALIPKVGDNMRIITPSKWLALEAVKSTLLAGRDVEYIPNFITNSTLGYQKDFQPGTQTKIRIGIASMEPFAAIKGGETVKRLIRDSQMHRWNVEIIFLSSFNHSEKAHFWSSIDILFVPSLADNSPNVIQEAKLAGLPIIARQVGGVSELLDDKYDLGFLHDDELFLDFYSKIEVLARNVGDTSSREIVIKKAQARNVLSITKHIELYKSIVK
jgi:glycosyltransferase involved in cell wall biosynthesis